MKTKDLSTDSQNENNLEIPEEYSIDLELDDIEIDISEIDESMYKPTDQLTGAIKVNKSSIMSDFTKFFLGLVFIIGIIWLIIALGPLWIIAILLFFIFIKK